MSLEPCGVEESSSSRRSDTIFFHRARISPSRLFGPVGPSRAVSFDDLVYHRRGKASKIEVLAANSEAKRGISPAMVFSFLCSDDCPPSATSLDTIFRPNRSRRPDRTGPRRTFDALA